MAAANNEKRKQKLAIKIDRLRNKQKVKKLIKLLNGKNDYVIGIAAKALGKLNDTTAMGYLINLVRYHRSREVRACAAEALGDMGNEGVIGALLKTFSEICDEYDKEYRKTNNYSVYDGTSVRILDVVRRFKGPKAVSGLTYALGSSDACIRKTAAELLGELEGTQD